MRGKSAPADVRIRGVASSISGFNMHAPCALRATKHHIEYIVLVPIFVLLLYLCLQHLKGLYMNVFKQPDYLKTPQCEHWKQLIYLDWSREQIFVFALLLAFCACTVVCTLCGTLQIMGRPEKTAITGLCRGQTVSSSSPPESFLPKTFQPFPAINCLRPRFKAPAIIAPRLIQCSS